MYKSLSEICGNTPLLELCGTEKKLGLKATLCAKLEFMNPAGSAKDRVAKEMLSAIPEGATIIEPTSGNTGIGLAALGVPMGHRVIFTMPDTMSAERVMTLKAYGAEVVFTPGALGMTGAHEKAEELKKSIPGSVIPDQFSNKLNPLAHYKTTGPEIFEALGKVPDVFVSGVGTGGTLSGTAKYLKEKGSVYAVAVEPDTSAVLSGEKAGEHKLQGMGAGFVPDALDTSLIDEVMKISYEEAKEAARLICLSDGVFAGVSGGAAAAAAIKIAQRPEMSAKTIAFVITDGGGKYLSTDLYE